MTEPLSVGRIQAPSTVQPRGPAGPGGGGAFAQTLRQQLEQVSALQKQADVGVEQLMTGQAHNVTEVFVAARQAEVAFSLLMEIRNKLVDAYHELKRMPS